MILPTGVNSTVLYKEVIGKIEFFNKVFWNAICVEALICICAALPYTYVRYYIYDLGEDSFYLFCPCWYVFTLMIARGWAHTQTDRERPSKYLWNITKLNVSHLISIRYPFDWKTPHGYIVAFLAQCAGATPMLYIFSQVRNFFELIFG